MSFNPRGRRHTPRPRRGPLPSPVPGLPFFLRWPLMHALSRLIRRHPVAAVLLLAVGLTAAAIVSRWAG